MEAIDFAKADNAYLYFDKTLIRRTKNLRLVPNYRNRTGGKISYGEWCHVIGIFQTLLFQHLNTKTDNVILDIGCGSGILGISSEPFLGKDGKYIGIDVNQNDIRFCKRHYPKDRFLFKHYNTFNSAYAPGQPQVKAKWDIEDKSIDMVTALSVWTHLGKEDAVFYFKEIDRVLKPDGKAIVTFFLLDDTYVTTLKMRSDATGRYHNTNQKQWVFDTPLSPSEMWFSPSWATKPEQAVGITPSGIDHLIQDTDLTLCNTYTGNWKEVPGLFFQDILVFNCFESDLKNF